MLNGEPFIVNGMNWDYLPIGYNYNYSLWSKSDNFIEAALDDEMSLLKNMGVNAIRVYTGIPKEWITYIYDNYGISTMINQSYGRYGLTIDGAWVPITDCASPKVEEILIGEVSEMAADYEGTRGLLCYLLGNENNYGLFWDGAETEDIPVEERKSTKRAQAMYSLINKGSLAIKAIDGGRPIAFSNGDLLFLDIIAQECGDLDIFLDGWENPNPFNKTPPPQFFNFFNIIQLFPSKKFYLFLNGLSIFISEFFIYSPW